MNLYKDNEQHLEHPMGFTFEITNQCMLRCKHCFNRSGNDLIRSELSDKEVLSIIDQICEKEFYTFCFCGGEPLLRYDLVLEMCKRLSKACQHINMVSNGYLMTEDKIIALKEAGLEHLQVSLDGFDSKTHDYMRGVNGAFEKAINAIKLANKHNLKISIAFCPTNFNIKQFPNLVELLSKYKRIVQIRTQPFMSLGRGSLNDISPSEEEYRGLYEYIFNHNKNHLSPYIEWGDPIDHLIRWKDVKNKKSTFVDIKSDGSLTASVYLPIILGNLKKHKLNEYWNAGLEECWKIPLIKEVAENQSSISYLGSSSELIPQIFYEKNLELDLIDDKVFENLDKFCINKFCKEIR